MHFQRFILSCALFFGLPIGFACTDFILQSLDGAYICGRTMEFALDLQTKVSLFPRKEYRVSAAPAGRQGVEWTAQYAYVAALALGQNIVVDGLNEAGLSYGALWLPGTQYPSAAQTDPEMTLDFADLGAWILGQFSTVAEVREGLKKVVVWGHAVPPIPGIAPLHLAIHDAKGKNLVVEFVKGEMKMYENPNGVLTNYPNFDWQLINLQNYLNLSPVNTNPIRLNGMALTPTGQGSGLFGIPGDWTPPSRFVRMTALVRFSKRADTALGGVNLAEHLINAVDIPMGDIREKKDSTEGDYTQWAVIKDLTNRVFYFRSYRDLALKFIDLKRVDLNQFSGPIPIEGGKGYLDITSSLKASRSFSQ